MSKAESLRSREGLYEPIGREIGYRVKLQLSESRLQGLTRSREKRYKSCWPIRQRKEMSIEPQLHTYQLRTSSVWGTLLY